MKNRKMRGDIHHSKIIRSLWGRSQTELFCDLLQIGLQSVWVCVYISICPCFECAPFVCRVITISFPPVFFFHSPFYILRLNICPGSFLSLSTMWCCLHPDAARRKRFRGCVTVCPLTISLYSSHLTVLMGFALQVHSPAELVVL